MPDRICFTPLHLADARVLRSEHNPLAKMRNLAETREALRQLLDLCNNQAWLACWPGDERIQAVLGFQMIDPLARRAFLHLYSADSELQPDVLKAILRKAFRESDIFRLELAVGEDKVSWLTILQSVGMVEEGRLRACQLDPTTKRHHDVLLYSILRPESNLVSSAFVPFRLGVFAITGDESALQETDFIHYGCHPNQHVLSESAEMLGLLNPMGEIQPRAALEKLLPVGQPFLIHPRASSVVRKAAEQAAAYFTGQLSQFDLPLDLSSGSSFQQRVWQNLANIPFGATWTYEELANHLSQDGWPEARKLARAVGSACGANPMPLILPCHRVIGKDGRLVGFSGGLDIKEYLLAHEMMGVNE